MPTDMTLPQAIARLVERHDLTAVEMTQVMRLIMTGQASTAQIGAILVALRMKGETVDEIAAAARVMRELVTPVPIHAPNAVDTCGTGGDAAGLFNVSTAAALVVAAAGGKVAKHGNRSVSSKSGSADLLEAAGVRLDLSAVQVARCVDEVGVGFMFAPVHHGAMKHAIGPRRELAIRTLFNLLGPLTNPAGVRRQVLGVFDRHWLRPLAEVLRDLGSDHALVVHAEDGLDEFSLAAPTLVAELRDGEVIEYRVTPQQVGLHGAAQDGLRVGNAEESLALIRAALAGKAALAAELIAFNAGAALYVAGVARDLKEGVMMADDTIATGLALEKLAELVEVTRCMETNA